MFWLIVAHCGGALGMGASVTLTFVLLLDVYVAQAHQSHLEAENPHFAVSSADGRNRERERHKRSATIQFWKINPSATAVFPR